MKIGAHNVINDVVHAFLPFNLISPPYTSSYLFSSYLAHFPNIVGLLDIAVVFPCKNVHHTDNENV